MRRFGACNSKNFACCNLHWPWTCLTFILKYTKKQSVFRHFPCTLARFQPALHLISHSSCVYIVNYLLQPTATPATNKQQTTNNNNTTITHLRYSVAWLKTFLFIIVTFQRHKGWRHLHSSFALHQISSFDGMCIVISAVREINP